MQHTGKHLEEASQLIKLLSFFYPTNVNWQLDQTKKTQRSPSGDRTRVFRLPVGFFDLKLLSNSRQPRKMPCPLISFAANKVNSAFSWAYMPSKDAMRGGGLLTQRLKQAPCLEQFELIHNKVGFSWLQKLEKPKAGPSCIKRLNQTSSLSSLPPATVGIICVPSLVPLVNAPKFNDRMRGRTLGA